MKMTVETVVDIIGELPDVDPITKLITHIFQAASTARSQKRVCRDFEEWLELVEGLLEPFLKTPEPVELRATSKLRTQLEESLKQAYKLVTKYKDRSFPYRLFTGTATIQRIRDEQKKIKNLVGLVPLIKKTILLVDTCYQDTKEEDRKKGDMEQMDQKKGKSKEKDGGRDKDKYTEKGKNKEKKGKEMEEVKQKERDAENENEEEQMVMVNVKDKKNKGKEQKEKEKKNDKGKNREKEDNVMVQEKGRDQKKNIENENEERRVREMDMEKKGKEQREKEKGRDKRDTEKERNKEKRKENGREEKGRGKGKEEMEQKEVDLVHDGGRVRDDRQVSEKTGKDNKSIGGGPKVMVSNKMKKTEPMITNKVVLEVRGMGLQCNCLGCKGNLDTGLTKIRGLKGVKHVDIDKDNNQVIVTGTTMDTETLRKTLRKALDRRVEVQMMDDNN